MRRELTVAGFLGVGGLLLLAEKFGHTKISQPVVIFDIGDDRSKVTITRQRSKIVDTARASNYTFTEDQLNKEYLVEVKRKGRGKKICDEPIFVRKGDGKMCSTGLFTKKKLTCRPLLAEIIGRGAEKLTGLRPRSDRGFGVEFEFIARPLSEQGLQKFKRLLEREYGSYDAGYLMGNRAAQFLAVSSCFKEVAHNINMSRRGQPCQVTSDCSLQQFCHTNNTCEDRLDCQHDADAKEGLCPMAPSKWEWAWDSSISPLSMDEAMSIGADYGETDGIAFEVTSPKPPYVLSGAQGFQSTYEILALLRQVGIQAGPSAGFHVHVNVMNSKAPGKLLSSSQVAAVWAAYAKYQLVIDEMLSPSRPGSQWSRRLFLGDCEPEMDRGDCSRDPCPCVHRVFNQMHQYLKIPRWLRLIRQKHTPLAFCNAALAVPGSRRPCQRRYPHQRYFQLNLVPLHRFGTIEFRAHSATYDPERIARWVQFLVAFVEYFGNGKGYRSMMWFFRTMSAKTGYKKLQKAQRQATAKELFQDLKELVDDDTADYYSSRSWERGDPTCQGQFKPTTAYCHSRVAFSHIDKKSKKDDKVDSPRPSSQALRPDGRSMACASRPNASNLANLTHAGGQQKVVVPVPSGAKVGSWLQAIMPEGDIRTELLDEDSIREGVHEFSYDLDDEACVRSILNITNGAKLDSSNFAPIQNEVELNF